MDEQKGLQTEMLEQSVVRADLSSWLVFFFQFSVCSLFRFVQLKSPYSLPYFLVSRVSIFIPIFFLTLHSFSSFCLFLSRVQQTE